MADVNRTLVNALVLHHAVTPLWPDKSKAWLAQWFSDNGFARAYGSNPANWSGLINPYTGGRSYSQAHFAGQQVDGSTPDATDAERAAGYRLVPLIQDVWGQITWHAGNWAINQSSIGIENLGDYRNYTLRDGDCRVIADFWRQRDRELSGNTAIYGHREVSQTGTECPSRIMEKRDTIVDYINSDPVTPPVVVPPTPTANVQRYERITPGTYRFVRNANLWNFDFPSQGEFTVSKSFNAGDVIDIVGKAVWKNGVSEYLMTAYSFGDADATGTPRATTGVNKVDVELVVPPTITTTEVIETKEVPYEYERANDPTLPVGETKVVQAGKYGVRTIVYTVTLTDGVETSRVVKSDLITTAPVTDILAVGTYVPPTTPTDPAEPQPGTDPLTALLDEIAKLLSKLVEMLGSILNKKGNK